MGGYPETQSLTMLALPLKSLISCPRDACASDLSSCDVKVTPLTGLSTGVSNSDSLIPAAAIRFTSPLA